MSVVLHWHGQSSFVVEDGETAIGLDLYLSDHLAAKYKGTDKPHDRLHPCPVTPADLAHLGWIFASHKHSDHLDPGSIADVLAAAPRARLVLPAPLVEYATTTLGLPSDRLEPVGPGDTVGPFTLVQAAHPETTPDVLSAIVDIGGVRLFHSGDSLTHPGQLDALRSAGIDYMLLPANGRVAEHLGTPPNMSLEEAVNLAAACGSVLIPHHWDLFAFNSRDEDDIRAVLGASGVDHVVMRWGETLELTPAA